MDLEGCVADFREALQNKDEEAIAQNLQYILMELWGFQWNPSQDDPLPDPTIRFLALMSVQRDGSLLEPTQVTPMLAKLERCIRLAFLCEIHCQVAKKDNGRDQEQAGLDLQKWYIEKVHSTFNSIRSLQHRASAIAFGTQSMPKVWWTDHVHFRSMLFQGHSIIFDQVCSVFQAMEQDTVDLWENKVLMGLRLQVKYDKLSDDLTNKTVHYSFLTDVRNPCFSDRTMLGTAILDDTILRNKFVKFDDNQVL